MSSFPKRASQRGKSSGKTEHLFELPTACKMLPLVGRILADLTEMDRTLPPFVRERNQLERHRRELTWPERQRRYQLEDEITTIENRRKVLFGEMSTLGVALIDHMESRVGFPTIVNGKPAYFSWQPAEETVNFWHYEIEPERRRPIPDSWPRTAQPKASKKRG